MKGRSEANQKLRELLKAIEERLNPSEMRIYSSLCRDYKFQRKSYSKFSRSLLLLIEKYEHLYQQVKEFIHGDKEKQEDEVIVGETQDDRRRDPKLNEKPKEDHFLGDQEEQEDEDTDIEEGEIREENLGDPKIGTGLDEIRVKVDENRKEQELGSYVCDKSNLERKKNRGILNQLNERPWKKTRTSKTLERVTPSYKLIPEEEQSPVSETVLNNECALVKVDIEGGKKLTDYEEEMKKCEDRLYKADMSMETLKSAVERTEKVMRGEMRMDDIGEMFYRCLKQLYRGDMAAKVKEDHQNTLPAVLLRLQQRLHKVTVARKKSISVSKQAMEKISAKQIDSTVQGHMKK